MSRKCYRRAVGVVFGAALAVGLAGSAPAEAALVYRNDFEGAIGPEFSNFATATTPVGGRRFLGRFDNNTVTLSLRDLPAHNQVKVSFDLYVINDWDGNGPDSGPDSWSLSLEGGPTLLRTTFSNNEKEQAYPEPFPGGENSARSEAGESNTLGYAGGDTVYRLTFTFNHNTRNLFLNFAGAGLAAGEETWGLDNLSVEVESNKPGKLSVSPKRLSFAKTAVGAARVKQVRLRNRSKGPLTGNVGFLMAPFRVISGSGSFTIPPRGSLTVEVEFAPTERGKVEDTLVVTSNDARRSPLNVRVGGRGK